MNVHFWPFVLSVYVDASEGCTVLSMFIGSQSSNARSWNIKVTQYDCEFTNLAPAGCTQWYFGKSSASVQSYNYKLGKGQHLAYQDQTICVRYNLDFP